VVVGEYSFEYDNLYQLVVASYPARGYEAFSYDKCGNRLTYTTNISGYSDASYTYNAANELLSDGIFTYEYDGNGNMKKKKRGTEDIVYEYDYKNQLTKITYPDASVNTFRYDGDGKRTQKVDSQGTVNYYWDGMSVGSASGGNVILETDVNNNVIAVYTCGVGVVSKKQKRNI
jgi:YD repeat-containing protein